MSTLLTNNMLWQLLHGIPPMGALILCCLLLVSGCGSEPTVEATTAGNQRKPAEQASNLPGDAKETDSVQDKSALDKAASESPGRSSEQTGEFEKQLALLAAGESDAIRLTKDAITKRQLQQLSRQPDLLDLLLDAGGPTEADLAIIAQFQQLEHLRIRISRMSDRGVQELCQGKLAKLQILNLPQAEIGERGILAMRKLPALTNLRLGGKQLDDDALAAIATLPNLKSLHLIGPSMTGKGLRSLARAPRLASFYLDECDLKDEDWEVLFSAKPNIHVHIDQQHHDRDPGKHDH